jgi:hypothetical protein
MDRDVILEIISGNSGGGFDQLASGSPALSLQEVM